MILPELSMTTPTPLVLSFRLTVLPALVMLPGAEIVRVSLPPRVCAAVVGVSICTFLALTVLALISRAMVRARRWGEKGMSRTAFCCNRGASCIASGVYRMMSLGGDIVLRMFRIQVDRTQGQKIAAFGSAYGGIARAASCDSNTPSRNAAPSAPGSAPA